MVSQNALACFLIVAAVLLLAFLNHAGWLLWLVPISFLLARGVAGGARGRNGLARDGRKG